jgi:hypothetical protein
MESRESADVSTPRIRTAERLRKWVLVFECRVNSPLRHTVKPEENRAVCITSLQQKFHEGNPQQVSEDWF